MKGATAEPWVSTTSPPRATMITTIGHSQYFLRARMKRHRSFTSDSIVALPGFLELVLHRVRPRGRLVRDPIALRGGLAAQAQQVLAEKPEYQAHRHDRHREHEAHQQRIDYCVQQLPDPGPQPVERGKGRGPEERGEREHGRRGEPPAVVGVALPEPQARDDREEGGEHE